VYRCPIARHERFPFGAALLSRLRPTHGRYILKTLFAGLCLLIVMTQATAAANGAPTTRATKTDTAATARDGTTSGTRAVSLESRLERKLEAIEKARSVIRFFERHRWLLSSTEHRPAARLALNRATERLARATRTAAAIRRALARRDQRRLANAPPKLAICDVFGRRYCRQALAVSWCESRHSTRARNGEYLGLFQMGWYERQRFGHGSKPRQQAVAAYRYFVRSGRDWSPWTCKPWW
jgi:hypothetical protein